MGTGFSFIRTRSAWQDMEYYRARRSAALKQDQANMDAINSAMMTAKQTQITTSSNLAANAALKRVQDTAKAKLAASTKELDRAQGLVEQTKASLVASTPAAPPSSSVVDTLA